MKKHDKSEYVEVKPGDRKNEIIASILDWLIAIAIGVLAGILLVVFVVQRDNVYGDSMVPNLRDGYIVMTDKLSTYFDNYHRGDIVILDGEDMEGYNHDEYLIRRIVGMPGEKLQIKDGSFYVNGKKLKARYISNSVADPGMASDEISIANDSYFVMSDNQYNMEDSRSSNIGNVKRSSVLGKAWFVPSISRQFGFIK